MAGGYPLATLKITRGLDAGALTRQSRCRGRGGWIAKDFSFGHDGGRFFGFI